MSTQQGVQGMCKSLINEHSMADHYRQRLQQTNCVIERIALVALFELLFTQTPPEPDKTRSSNR